MTIDVELYETLGLDRSASSEQIKQAYKRLAREWHPDKATDESKREDFGKKFQSLNHAYSILSDDTKRALYDSQQYIQTYNNESSTHFSVFRPFGSFSFAANLNSDHGFDDTDYHMRRRGSASQIRRKSSAPASSSARRFSYAEVPFKPRADSFEKTLSKRRHQMAPVQFDIPVTLEEFFHGCIKKRKIIRKRLIPNFSLVEESEILTIEIKPGWRDGTKLTYEGFGDEDEYRTPGDLVFNLCEKDHEVFKREGKNNLSYVHTVSLRDALTKESFCVPTICGEGAVVLLREGEIVTPHTVHTIIGYGMPSAKNPSERGCLYVNYEIIYPSEICTSLKMQLSRLIPDENSPLEQEHLHVDSSLLAQSSKGLLETEESSLLNLQSKEENLDESTGNEPVIPSQFEAIAEEPEQTGAISPDEGSTPPPLAEETAAVIAAECSDCSGEVEKGADSASACGAVSDVEEGACSFQTKDSSEPVAPALSTETDLKPNH